MHVSECYGPGKFGLSFELFPPKTADGERALFRHVSELARFEPNLITCTYGAGGSTRNKTLEIVMRVHQEFGCSVAAHLTCVGSTVEQLRGFLVQAEARGVENVVALRGDPPQGATRFQAVTGGFSHANELVTLIRNEFPQLGIAVAGYPEKHQEAPSFDVDLENLKRKVDCGADAVFTQLFYDNHDFFRFRERAKRVGVDVPIVPGILPVTNLAQVRRITALCGAHFPAGLENNLQAQTDHSDAQFEVGVEFATRQVQELMDQGVPGIHFYVLNRSQATAHVLSAVGRTAV